ncbi:aspartate carbamoyltransferase catalytic subunit [Vulgatibacter incomptus]|uniref:Aspartate carbamoyltransferase n=1 Tax=Vulgatibacter incomptus TaxID=1391653 RepID=A0A0K1PD24_9BACT|nr:aspartate carbamoyltransferase catalytic subunit [Vulgatibacter incomptus]AKU91024.1 Aspartate carbamoyltransferase [Vulgatibacter incomptus]
MTLARKHLLGIEPLERAEIEEILGLAVSMKELLRQDLKKSPALRGKTVINCFFESSTRTRSSFEIAAKILSADAVNWSSSGSSVSKGESLIDTAKNLEAMRPDILVIRHAASGAPHLVASRVGCAVVNAGDGAHEHPSQALLDAFTLRERWGSLEGRTVAIVGDIRHSRVARSNIYCLRKLGARVRLCGPPTMIPIGIEALGCDTTFDLREAVTGADAVMMLRIQNERIAGSLFPSTREYSKLYGLSQAKTSWLKDDALILHPGPINRGVELEPEVADGERSVILDQVENGVAVRMAILQLLAGGVA